MDKNYAKIILLITIIQCSWAAETTDTPKLHRYESVRDVLAHYNQHRIDLSKIFEESGWNETPQLPQNIVAALKEKSENKEFSTVESAQLLFNEIKYGNIVTDVKTLEGGFVSGQIYRVTTYSTKLSKEQIFYIKYLRTKPILVSKGRVLGEQINLDNLAKSPFLEPTQEQFDIMLPIATFQYGKKVFMVIPSAKGESFTSIVKNDLGQTVDLAFSALGKALGNLHLKTRNVEGSNLPKTLQDFINVKVISHGDLHGDNVFFDNTTGRLSLIDVETMANSIDAHGTPNSPIFYDMFYMLLMSSKKFGDYMKTNKWSPFISMFRAYISVYPEDERKGIYDYLIYCLNHTKKIKFTDLFENFTINKGFGSGRIAGAHRIATALEQDRDKLFAASSSERRFVAKKTTRSTDHKPEHVKKVIERQYTTNSSSATASSSMPIPPSPPTGTDEAPMNNQDLSIKPGNVKALKSFWENQSHPKSDAKQPH